MNRSHKTKYALLGMLSIEPMSGYDIKKTLHTSTNFFWQESDGQIYPALAKLLKEKAITIVPDKSEDLRPRKIYKITAKGMKELQHWLIKEPAPSVPRNELLLKLFFGANVSVDENRHHIVEHQRHLARHLEIYKQIAKSLENDPSAHLPYWLLTLKFGQQIINAQLEWCEEALKILARIK